MQMTLQIYLLPKSLQSSSVLNSRVLPQDIPVSLTSARLTTTQVVKTARLVFMQITENFIQPLLLTPDMVKDITLHPLFQ